MTNRPASPSTLSPGEADSLKLKNTLKSLSADESILIEPTAIDALADDLLDSLDGRPLDASAAGHLYEMLMEADVVEDVFISKDELADALRG